MTMHGACPMHCAEHSPSNARTDVTDGRTDGDPTHLGEIRNRFVTRAMKAHRGEVFGDDMSTRTKEAA